MTSDPVRPRPIWLQRAARVLLRLFMLFTLVNLAGSLRDARPVQRWWARQTGLPVYLNQPDRRYQNLSLAARSPDGRWVAGGGTREYGTSYTFRTTLWNAATMVRRWTTDRPTTDFRSVNILRWSPDSRSVWTHDTEGG